MIGGGMAASGNKSGAAAMGAASGISGAGGNHGDDQRRQGIFRRQKKGDKAGMWSGGLAF